MKYVCKFCRESFDEPTVIDYGVGRDDFGFHSLTDKVSPCCDEDFWIDIDDEFLIDRERNEIKREDL